MATPAGQMLYTPTGSGAPYEPGGAGTPLAEQIVAAASTPQFANDFGGADFAPDGTVTIYATAAGYETIQSALTTSFGAAAARTYTITVVPRSLYELEADTLAAEATGIPSEFVDASAPFIITALYPDSASGTVQFSVIGDPVRAQATLARLLPTTPISVVQSDALGPPVPDSGRYADLSPFSAGAAINIAGHSGGPCTANFTYIGNYTGNLYPFTAAHCDPDGAGAAVTTAAGTPISHISTRYNSGVDFASYECNNCQGRVWYTSSATHLVGGQCSCYGKGNSVTMDGQATGEVPGFQVQWNAPGCAPSTSTCGVEYAINGGTSDGCKGGDSGGPVYQREGNPLGSYVDATGLILYNVVNHDNECYYQAITVIENDANVGIETGG